MKLCFPTTRNQGMYSQIFGHFGSAPLFLLVDSQSEEVQVQANGDRGHQHGRCRPLRALAGQAVDAIVVGGIGQGALTRLTQSGLKVYQAVPGTVADNLAQAVAGQLKELTAADVCTGHSQGHGHGHGHGQGSRSEFDCGF